MCSIILHPVLAKMIDTIATIPEFYRGKSVFVTGASGFIGKVLVEKLLRSCPDIGKIYILLRPKKNKTLEDRMKSITDKILFDKVKELHPENMKKLQFVAGDISEINLGLSPDNYDLLVNNVDVIFHVAATVKFQAPLSDSALINIRGTREICNLALAMKKKTILLYVSTSYCHHENQCIKEKTYEPYGDWRKTIKIAESMDRHILNVITAKMKGVKENTYTFTKAQAEQVVLDLCVGKIPTIILRPAIVFSVVDDPIPGYSEGFTGHIGILAGTISGLLKCINSSLSFRSEAVPVDYIVKGLVNSVWMKGTGQSEEPVSIYNGSCKELLDINNEICITASNNSCLKTCTVYNWYPHIVIIKSQMLYYLYSMIFQLLPSVIGDVFINLKIGKPFLVKVQRNVFASQSVLKYFSNNEWDIQNSKFVDIITDAPNDDNFIIKLDDPEFYENCALNTCNFIIQHYFNLKLTENPTSSTKLMILKTLYYMVHFAVYSILAYTLFSVVY
ncbi:PREDICTED: fatty acyl-CoA reductase 1-like [Nicrophorus vespilloides]|uniref:Fatty acyl-CoA reductase n=1 Tax=Nicrophorus vespilloides TaxID=110193 RepID=A0ABM1MJC4_NICVS|nr:PREDICTED: fatty acyl-CoA reductase 1-like [Nicrophorus vespilloides]